MAGEALKDGKEAWKPMDVGIVIFDLAVAQDGRWIAGVTGSGKAIVWDAKPREKVTEFCARSDWARAADVQQMGQKSQQDRMTLSVRSFPAGKRLLGPFERNNDFKLAAVKFSPNGRRRRTSPLPRIVGDRCGATLFGSTTAQN